MFTANFLIPNSNSSKYCYLFKSCHVYRLRQPTENSKPGKQEPAGPRLTLSRDQGESVEVAYNYDTRKENCRPEGDRNIDMRVTNEIGILGCC
jgi:hypothetical protein